MPIFHKIRIEREEKESYNPMVNIKLPRSTKYDNILNYSALFCSVVGLTFSLAYLLNSYINPNKVQKKLEELIQSPFPSRSYYTAEDLQKIMPDLYYDGTKTYVEVNGKPVSNPRYYNNPKYFPRLHAK